MMNEMMVSIVTAQQRLRWAQPPRCMPREFGGTRCNVSIPARLESILKPPDYRTLDLRVPDSGLGPPRTSALRLRKPRIDYACST